MQILVYMRKECVHDWHNLVIMSLNNGNLSDVSPAVDCGVVAEGKTRVAAVQKTA